MPETKRVRVEVDDEKENGKKSLMRRKMDYSSKLGNKILAGLTFGVGVASFALFAMNSPKGKQSHQLLSKALNLLSYK